MSDNSQNRVEAQLRRWGADESALQQAPRQPADWKPPRRSDPFATVRWLIVAATVIVVVGASLWVTQIVAKRPPASRPEDLARIKHLNGQLVEAQTQADGVRQKLAAADERIRQLASRPASMPAMPAEQEAAFREQIAGLKKSLAETNDLLTAERKQVAALNTAVAELRPRAEQADKLARELAETGKRLVEADKRLAEADKRLVEDDSRLAEAKEQIDTLTRQQRDLVESQKKLGEDLAELRRQSSNLMTYYQRAYILASSGEQGGWRGRKLAARRNRLIERAAGLRATVHEAPMRQLIDRTEVLLTRLDLSETSDAAAVNAFTELVESSRIAEQIDQALATGQLNASARMWLLEAKLVLTGVDHVG